MFAYWPDSMLKCTLLESSPLLLKKGAMIYQVVGSLIPLVALSNTLNRCRKALVLSCPETMAVKCEVITIFNLIFGKNCFV